MNPFRGDHVYRTAPPPEQPPNSRCKFPLGICTGNWATAWTNVGFARGSLIRFPLTQASKVGNFPRFQVIRSRVSASILKFWNEHWGDIFTLIGLVITILGVWKTKNAAEKAAEA